MRSPLLRLEDLVSSDTPIRRVSDRILLLTTFFFILTVVSFDPYAVGQLFPLLIFPLSIGALSAMPAIPILRRLIFAIPFVFFIGIWNPIFDRTLVPFMGIEMARGWFSFFSIQIRLLLTVSSTLILTGIIGFTGMNRALLELKIPAAFVSQLMFLNRYMEVLVEESRSIQRAYVLRCKRITMGSFGPLMGQLLVRTYYRSERIERAMLCREYTPYFSIRAGASPAPLSPLDALFLTGWGVFFLSVRCIHIPLLSGEVFLRRFL